MLIEESTFRTLHLSYQMLLARHANKILQAADEEAERQMLYCEIEVEEAIAEAEAEAELMAEIAEQEAEIAAAEFQAEKEQLYFEIDMANAEAETLEMEQAILYAEMEAEARCFVVFLLLAFVILLLFIFRGTRTPACAQSNNMPSRRLDLRFLPYHCRETDVIGH
jgi:hypothetical protein